MAFTRPKIECAILEWHAGCCIVVDDEDRSFLARNFGGRRMTLHIREGAIIANLPRLGLLLLALVVASCDSGASLGPIDPAEQRA